MNCIRKFHISLTSFLEAEFYDFRKSWVISLIKDLPSNNYYINLCTTSYNDIVE